MSELCEKHRKGYEPLKLGVLTPLCPLCLQADIKRMAGQIDEQNKENKRLKEALVEYGEHKQSCPRPREWEPCSCGFEQALKVKENG